MTHLVSAKMYNSYNMERRLRKIHLQEVDVMESQADKSRRVLEIYTSLLEGKTIYKKELAQKYEVNERTIQRDFDDIRGFLDKQAMESGVMNYLIYDKLQNGYRLERTSERIV